MSSPSSEPPRPRHAPSQRRVIRSVRRIVRAIELYSRRLSVAHGVTVPQVLCLADLDEASEPLSVSALSAAVHMSASTVVGVLDRLERKGLVVRERDTGDRRRVFVVITDAGRAVVAEAPSLLQDRLAVGLERLTDDEQATVAAALERVVELMEAEDVSAAPVLDSGAELS